MIKGRCHEFSKGAIQISVIKWRTENFYTGTVRQLLESQIWGSKGDLGPAFKLTDIQPYVLGFG